SPHPLIPKSCTTPDWQGNTLVLNAGAIATELALVNLPATLTDLSHSDFHIRSFPFAGNGIDQDIIIQLLYPLLQIPDADRVNPMAHLDLSLETVSLEGLNLEHLTLPAPGEPDLLNRYGLQQRLESMRTGQILLEVARCVKIVLQLQNRFTLRLGDRRWTILRQDLGSKVLLPYVQRLNRELNSLLAQLETPVSAVNQVICTGGTASMGAIARWLRQKLPNATIIQDTYARPVVPQDNCISSCSRVAYGLAVLPLHPKVLDSPRQAYSDYFLLLELLRSFPNRSMSVSEVLQMLHQRGIDTQACHSQILSLLDGYLPPGLVPSEPEAIALTRESSTNPDLKAVQIAPLFHKQANQMYRPNRYQWNQLKRYLDTLLSHTHQKLDKPLPTQPVA
ncbi:MAG: hypothetical protein HC769_26725, partial [Cyanobacteria bacterium CRU_2_1]|nr:hypothetical protein [Cyanobacteria bacterium CRU_2_1]